MLDAYVAAGGNAIDTANVYSAWVPGNRGGESEDDHRAVARRPRRPRRRWSSPPRSAWPAGPASPRGSSASDHPARRRGVAARGSGSTASTSSTPTRTIPRHAARGDAGRLRRAGARGPGARHRRLELPGRAPDRGAEAQRGSDGLARFEALQPPYNLAGARRLRGRARRRSASSRGLGVATYYSLARGFLTGKYRRGGRSRQPARAGRGARLHERPRPSPCSRPSTASRRPTGRARPGVPRAGSWPGPASPAPIASATTPDQARELMGAVEDLELSDDEARRAHRSARSCLNLRSSGGELPAADRASPDVEVCSIGTARPEQMSCVSIVRFEGRIAMPSLGQSAGRRGRARPRSSPRAYPTKWPEHPRQKRPPGHSDERLRCATN